MELRSRQLRLVLAAGLTRRRQVAVLDEAPRSGGVEGGIFRSDGGQPIDVPVEHAEHRGDQNGIVDLQVSRICCPGLRYKGSGANNVWQGLIRSLLLWYGITCGC